MYHKTLAMLLGMLGIDSANATSSRTPAWMQGYKKAALTSGFRRNNGTHGSTRRRRAKSLRAKARHHGR